MYILRRWWDRHGLVIVLGGLALIVAWSVRHTQGAAIFQVYQLITRPLASVPTPEERLIDARVLELQQRIVELESQNKKLKELLGYVETKKMDGIVTPIIGRSADHWWQQLILGRGSNDGIEVGFVVMGTGGLVGRVISVTPNSSRILLITDSTSHVGTVIGRSRSMGFIRGQGSNRAVMEFFDKLPEVRRGDSVSTSPVSQLFPPGLPVGRVESVNLDKSPAPEAVIELTSPINHLEWVIVMPR
ncbi:MAG: rod shape-determining protein MreC [Symploca sp. SIO3C6]|uniref:Cell shape-determining protein MreC n=1 Tax=Symploca sp. SIO1C4 TaxID=2607765 RepID=A0A6B3N7R3_9CYAN|nr:rod shape-determining protein MreC [Symploca sp. SIO3C6]NER29656.1 rod shape-determining protein MreC [Symploca sp. SIO1C4]NET03801.1 rod shape-determining protein MreC [Symploca sp. SIO2B6]